LNEAWNISDINTYMSFQDDDDDDPFMAIGSLRRNRR
jgi:hypothetical protein